MLCASNGKIALMGRNARKTAEMYYSEDVHYTKLMDIYKSAILKRK